MFSRSIRADEFGRRRFDLELAAGIVGELFPAEFLRNETHRFCLRYF